MGFASGSPKAESTVVAPGGGVVGVAGDASSASNAATRSQNVSPRSRTVDSTPVKRPPMGKLSDVAGTTTRSVGDEAAVQRREAAVEAVAAGAARSVSRHGAGGAAG
jgi:hypothetical protein